MLIDFLTSQEIACLLSVPHFKDSPESRQKLDRLYASYALCFADLVGTYQSGSEPKVIADIGTGYGWLAIALARRTSAQIIAVDPNGPRMQAARKIAAALGVEQRIEWRSGALPNLPLADREADVTYCVEVIEHVGTEASVVAELGRITRDMLVISTPNKLFPWIQHDTGLPFCHWLPLRARDVYAGFAGKRHLQDSNLFWSPNMLRAALPEFERISSLLQFKDVGHFLMVERMLEQAFGVSRVFRRTVFSAVSLLGPFALYGLPNLASAFRRRVASPPS